MSYLKPQTEGQDVLGTRGGKRETREQKLE